MGGDSVMYDIIGDIHGDASWLE